MYRLAAGEEVERFTAWKTKSPDGKRFGLFAGHGRRGAAKYCVLALYAWLQPLNPNATTRATSGAHCCAKPLPSISRGGSSCPMMVSDGQFDGQGDHHTPRAFVRQAFCKYLKRGILAHGFAQARYGNCCHDYFVAFSCKSLRLCPSCNTRRMLETAAHLTDHVFTAANLHSGRHRR